jgi:hypothetical protein
MLGLPVNTNRGPRRVPEATGQCELAAPVSATYHESKSSRAKPERRAMIPGKLYTVFLSSTTEDLPAERAAVSRAILSNGGIPIGMEQFPAGVQKLDYIKSLIDKSDYLVVVSKSYYGSIEPDSGLSYTEWEVRYAIQKGVPVIPFLIRLGKLTKDETDKIENYKKLVKFHELLDPLNCIYFTSPSDLAEGVGRSLHAMYREHPRTGWVSAETALARTPLEGVWEFRPDASIGADQARQVGDGVRRFKFYTESTFTVYHVESGNTVRGVLSGRYELVGNTYREFPTTGNGTLAHRMGKDVQGTVEISGPSMRMVGPGFNETWYRSSLP